MLRPLPGRIGTARIFVHDASINGIRIAHQGNIPKPGTRVKIEFEWDGEPLRLECEIVHNELHRMAKTPSEKSVYHAGLHIVSATGNSAVLLRKVVTEHVERALDEQRANARGLPAVAAHAFQTGKTKEYLRCQLVKGTWKRTAGPQADQPENGFTVSAAEDPAQVDMLCQAYERGDEETRKLIRTMAKASTTEAVPTRRYVP